MYSLAQCCTCGELREVAHVFGGHKLCEQCLRSQSALCAVLIIDEHRARDARIPEQMPYPFSAN